ncbi:MAG: hypothetical protein Q4G62_00350 [Pseudomonadota bacterium]|nr:hypothetical protein [Pseudomonadota bacterium]
MRNRYFISLPEPEQARGADGLGFTSHGADGFAEELQAALRGDGLFKKWLATQHDPEDVDPKLAATDPAAEVSGKLDDLHIDLEAVTDIGGDVLKHRLRLLAGNHWQLRDVRAA